MEPSLIFSALAIVNVAALAALLVLALRTIDGGKGR